MPGLAGRISGNGCQAWRGSPSRQPVYNDVQEAPQAPQTKAPSAYNKVISKEADRPFSIGLHYMVQGRCLEKICRTVHLQHEPLAFLLTAIALIAECRCGTQATRARAHTVRIPPRLGIADNLWMDAPIDDMRSRYSPDRSYHISRLPGFIHIDDAPARLLLTERQAGGPKTVLGFCSKSGQRNHLTAHLVTRRRIRRLDERAAKANVGSAVPGRKMQIPGPAKGHPLERSVLIVSTE